MDSSAKRRLESISRHLISPQITATHPLSQLEPESSLGSATSSPSSTSPSPVIIGGMVLDIHGKPHQDRDTRRGTTVPGSVKFMNGGVARNVAECMSKLGTRPFIISVIGDDMAGKILLNYWESAGLSTQGILQLQDATTPIVTNIFDRKGEVAAGVASVEAVEKFVTPNLIWKFKQMICSAPVVMVDANLHPQSLEAVCKIAADSGVPVLFEPVSVTKAARIASIAKYITFASPNEDELVAMANAVSSGKEFSASTKRMDKSIDSVFNAIKPAIRLLLEKGIKLLIVTIGSDGVFICFKNHNNCLKDRLKNHHLSSFGRQLYELMDITFPLNWKSFLNSDSYAFHLPALPASVVSLVGAGDCLVAGILASICIGLDVMKSVAIGVVVAKAAVENESNVPSQFNLKELAAGAQQILSSARLLMLD